MSESTQYIAEPWHECANGDCQCGQILGPNSEHICTVKNPAARRRILACVNACAGIETEVLEQHALGVVAADSSMLKHQGDQLEDVESIISRRGDIEQRLFDVASGKAPMLTKADCRIMALRLGTPKEHWNDIIKKHKWGE